MGLADNRRPPFVWLSNESLARIETELPGTRQAGARSTLLGMAQAANARRDGHHEEGDTLAVIARHSCISARRALDYLRDLASVGLVDIEPQTDGRGRALETIYRLVDSPDDLSGRPDVFDAKLSGRPDDLSTELSGPTCARPESEKKEEERERERERACEQPSDRSGGDQSGAVQAVVATFEALLTQRGRRLGASDQLSLVNAARSAPEGIDLVAVAGRLASNYGPGGIAERQPIRSVAGLLNEAIDRSTPGKPKKDRPKAPSGHVFADQDQDGLKRHCKRPAMDPAPKDVADAWEYVLHGLQQSTGAWASIHTVGLAGVITLLVDEAGGDSDQPEQVIVLDADPSQLSWLAANGHRSVVRMFEHVLRRDVNVEIAPRASAVTRAVA